MYNEINNVIPLKKFGQNYLKDKNILKKIAEEIYPQKNDLLLEIGPGTGALTEFLTDRTDNYIAVEIDKRVIDFLKTTYPSVNFIQADFLKYDVAALSEKFFKPIKIAGNIPYNLTSPILFKLLENRKYISDSVLMMQFEVAKRLVAKRGTKDYGILSIIMNTFAEVKFCFKVSANVFHPKPKVDSAIVHLFYNKENQQIINKRLYINVVKAAFGKRRKTLKNALAHSTFNEINFANAPVDMALRAEQLTIDDFIELANFVANQ